MTPSGACPNPRFAPRFTLPPYRYVPGATPHPFRHEGGHLRTRDEALADAPRDERFRFGVDLYNRRFFWEAHEVWEELWHGTARGSLERALLQSLIQLAAARLKREMGEDGQADRLLVRARERLEPFHGESGEVHGLAVATAVAAIGDAARGVLARLPMP